MGRFLLPGAQARSSEDEHEEDHGCSKRRCNCCSFIAFSGNGSCSKFFKTDGVAMLVLPLYLSRTHAFWPVVQAERLYPGQHSENNLEGRPISVGAQPEPMAACFRAVPIR